MPERTSWLGIIETLLAAALLWVIAVEFGQWRYLLGISLIAPFLLLRTNHSVVLGRWWFESWYAKQFQWYAVGWRRRPAATARRRTVWYEEARGLGRSLWFCAKVALAGFVCRIGATLVILRRRPLMSLRAIPANWHTAWFELDLRTPVEIVPSAGMYPAPVLSSPWIMHGRPTLPGMILLILTSTLALLVGVGMGILGTAIGVAIEQGWRGVIDMLTGGGEYGRATYVMFAMTSLSLWLSSPRLVSNAILQIVAATSVVIAWWYRWILKSTLLVYAPLIYFVSDSFDTRKVPQHLYDARRTLISKMILCYAVVVSTVFITKYVALIAGYKLAHALEGTLGGYAEMFLQPVRICLWQVFAIVSGAITVGVFLFCDRELVRRESKTGGYRDRTVAIVLGTATYVRILIAYYTVSCTLWIIWSIVRHSQPFPRTWEVWP